MVFFPFWVEEREDLQIGGVDAKERYDWSI